MIPRRIEIGFPKRDWIVPRFCPLAPEGWIPPRGRFTGIPAAATLIQGLAIASLPMTTATNLDSWTKIDAAEGDVADRFHETRRQLRRLRIPHRHPDGRSRKTALRQNRRRANHSQRSHLGKVSTPTHGGWGLALDLRDNNGVQAGVRTGCIREIQRPGTGPMEMKLCLKVGRA